MTTFKSYNQFYSILDNHGYNFSDRDSHGRPNRILLNEWLQAGQAQLREEVKNGIEFNDSLATPDIQPWLPRTMTERAILAQEPLLVLSKLFQRMNYEAGAHIEFPAMGAVGAAVIAEGDSYPTVQLTQGGGSIITGVAKHGVAFKISEEARNRSSFDLVQLHLDACGMALARHKEQCAADVLQSQGLIAFDNIDPSTSAFGVTTGRGLSGTANGSLTLDDLFDTYALLLDNGFVPDTLLMHPLCYIMFMKDPVLRAVLLAGGNQVFFGSWSGNPAAQGPGSPLHVSGAQSITPSGSTNGGAASKTSEYSQITTSAPNLPARWPFPLRIVVSPFLNFDARTKRAELILCSLADIGVYVEEYGVRTQEWADLERDVNFYKLREAYHFYIRNEGRGIARLRNVKVIPNLVNLPGIASHSISGSIADIDPSVAV